MPSSFRSKLAYLSRNGIRQANAIKRSFGQALNSDMNPMPRALKAGVADRGVNIPFQSDSSGKAEVKKKEMVAKPETLRTPANSDAVTWSIMKAIRVTINQVSWDIVPKVNDLNAEIDRWYEQCCDMIDIDDPDKAIAFASPLLSPEMVGHLRPEVKKVLSDKTMDPRAKRFRLESMFRIVKREIEQTAIVHAAIVRRSFIRPNEFAERSMRALDELVVSDLLIYDAGVIVKNDNYFGELAELYHIPGYQIYPIALPDRTIPTPPWPAYVWDTQQNQYKLFTSDQLIYMMANPQGNYYGMSPIEALVYVITSSILGDKSYIDELREGSMPPAIMNLGGVNETQRARFEAKLTQMINKTNGGRMAVIGEVPTDDGKYQIDWVPKLRDFRSMQIVEYMNLAPAIKALAFGLSAGDVQIISDPKINDSEVAAALSQRRGVTSITSLLQSYKNQEIVDQCWPFDDVEFAYDVESLKDTGTLQSAQADAIDIANGSMTRNERRLRRGLRPLPGGSIATVTTGNVLYQVDSLSPNMGDDEEDTTDPTDPQGGGDANPAQGGGNTPVLGDPKNPDNSPQSSKRNNATKRKIMSGT